MCLRLDPALVALESSLYPVLMCNAAAEGDIERICELKVRYIFIVAGYKLPHEHYIRKGYDRTLILFVLEGKVVRYSSCLDFFSYLCYCDNQSKYLKMYQLRIAVHEIISNFHLMNENLLFSIYLALNDALLQKDKGISLFIHDYDMRTPIHLACAEGHLETVKFLLENGCSVHSVDRSVVVYVVLFGQRFFSASHFIITTYTHTMKNKRIKRQERINMNPKQMSWLKNN